MAGLVVPSVDVAPAEVRLPAGLWAALSYLSPVQLGVALSLLHPADPHLCAARAAVDVAELRFAELGVMTEVSHQIAGGFRERAAGNLARRMAAEPIRPLQQPRQPVRCDACTRVRAPLRPVPGRWRFAEEAAS